MFVGRFEHTLDAKGRVVLPAQYRRRIADVGYLAHFERCLGLWTEEGFTEVVRRLNEKVRLGVASLNALRGFTSNSAEVAPDGQGRITVPQHLRELAGLQKELVIVGATDRVELWDALRWEALEDKYDDSLINAVTDLGIA